MSKAGCPYDNAPMERFYNTVKNELVYPNEFNTKSELDEAISRYVFVWYNHIRPYSYNKGKTPFEARTAGWFFEQGVTKTLDHYIVEVVGIEYFNDENVPLPIEKTKRIIRKCMDEDFDLPEPESSVFMNETIKKLSCLK